MPTACRSSRSGMEPVPPQRPEPQLQPTPQLRQHRIFNPLCQARDQTRVLALQRCCCSHRATAGTPSFPLLRRVRQAAEDEGLFPGHRPAGGGRRDRPGPPPQAEAAQEGGGGGGQAGRKGGQSHQASSNSEKRMLLPIFLWPVWVFSE